MIKRVQYIIKAVNRITIVFIDYVVNSTIINQIKLTFNNIDKLNLKLIKTLIYLSQFNLKIKYRSKK